MLKARRVVLLWCLALLAALPGCRSAHDAESFYATRVDAANKGEFERGWLPEFLPASSHTIHLAYDLSPSRVWCSFAFDPADADKLLLNLQLAESLPPAMMRLPSPSVKWWPKPLEGEIELQKLRAAGLVLYTVTRPASQVANEDLLFAVDTKNGHGYFYGH